MHPGGRSRSQWFSQLCASSMSLLREMHEESKLYGCNSEIPHQSFHLRFICLGEIYFSQEVGACHIYCHAALLESTNIVCYLIYSWPAAMYIFPHFFCPFSFCSPLVQVKAPSATEVTKQRTWPINPATWAMKFNLWPGGWHLLGYPESGLLF